MPPAFTVSLPWCELTAVSQRDHVCTITAHTTVPTARCPRCGVSAQRIYRDYTRRPRHLPLWAYAVRLVLHVRRLRYLHTNCTAHTFAERLLSVGRPAAQRTVRLTIALPPLGLARGAVGGHAPCAN
jgi:transposase